MSPNSEKSDWVQNELLLAKQLNKIIYTFLLEGERWWNVQSIQYIDVRNGEMPTEKFILSLAKVISESEKENRKNVTINVEGNVQGNIVVGDGNKIDSSVNKRESISAKETKEKVKPFTGVLNPSSLTPQNKIESKRAKQNNNFLKLGIGGVILISVLGALSVVNYFLNNMHVNETPEIISTETSVPSMANDGMALVYIPAGEFIMGSDNGEPNEQPVHLVYLDAFWIDKTEVTNAMYIRCVEAQQCNPPGVNNSYSRSSYFGNSKFNNFPVIYVSWNDAKTYCEYAGRRLPTEAEWEKAARGTEGNIYPWGNADPQNNLLNFNYTFGDTIEVGSFSTGASIYGVLDMAGNVWEWVNSLYQPYPYDANDGRDNLTVDGPRVLRGGSWVQVDSASRSAVRISEIPSVTLHLFGFRCAMDADQ